MPRISLANAFSIDAPGDWTLSTLILSGPVEEAKSSGMLTTKAVRPFQQNLIATMEQVDQKETPKSYVDKQLEGLRKAGVQRQQGAPPEDVKLADGSSGLLTEQIVVGPGGERVRQLQLVSIKRGVAFTLIASQLDGAPYEKSKKGFREMLLSFE